MLQLETKGKRIFSFSGSVPKCVDLARHTPHDYRIRKAVKPPHADAVLGFDEVLMRRVRPRRCATAPSVGTSKRSGSASQWASTSTQRTTTGALACTWLPRRATTSSSRCCSSMVRARTSRIAGETHRSTMRSNARREKYPKVAALLGGVGHQEPALSQRVRLAPAGEDECEFKLL